jgi:hypothetical protein
VSGASRGSSSFARTTNKKQDQVALTKNEKKEVEEECEDDIFDDN